MKSIFEDFLQYCKEDNEKLSKDISIWLADYFDLPHRVMPLIKEEVEWINANLSKDYQRKWFGMTAEEFTRREYWK